MIDFAKRLNSSQLEAVTATEGPVLVIAGAGSGKTRTIEYRVLYLVDKKLDPASILLLTFTRRAAHEMLSRARIHDERCRYVEGGTFHSFAFKALRKHARSIGLANNFSVLDEDDCESIVQRCMGKIMLVPKDKKFPKKNTVRRIVSTSVNRNFSIPRVLEKDYPHFIDYASDIENIKNAYTRYKRDKNYMDYDDLLIYLKRLLEEKHIREIITRRYGHVMVDEYQDTNSLQGDTVWLLGRDIKNIMAVGDDAQSIYGFRGASHDNIMAFPKKFPGCRIIKLEENYRSVQAVLNVANAVLENMRNKYSKCLVSARKDEGQRPWLVFFSGTSHQESGWVTAKIGELHKEGQKLTDIAVLFRSSYISIPLQAELARHGIPYRVFGGLKFYETAHMKDLIAHLRLLKNMRDELSWTRALTLIEGIGVRSSEKILEEISPLSTLKEVCDKLVSRYGRGFHYSEALKDLFNALRSASGSKVTCQKQCAIMFDYYAPLLKDKFDDWHLRISDLEVFKDISRDYTSLEVLLSDFAIEPSEKGLLSANAERDSDKETLTLSTIHSAKGLEWRHVFLIGLVDGLLPISFALNDDDDIEEEQRLFYVAVTRAKDALFMSTHNERNRGGFGYFGSLSRFIEAPNILKNLEQYSVSDDGGPELKNTDAYYRDPALEDIIDLLA